MQVTLSRLRAAQARSRIPLTPPQRRKGRTSVGGCVSLLRCRHNAHWAGPKRDHNRTSLRRCISPELPVDTESPTDVPEGKLQTFGSPTKSVSTRPWISHTEVVSVIKGDNAHMEREEKANTHTHTPTSTKAQPVLVPKQEKGSSNRGEVCTTTETRIFDSFHKRRQRAQLVLPADNPQNTIDIPMGTCARENVAHWRARNSPCAICELCGTGERLERQHVNAPRLRSPYPSSSPLTHAGWGGEGRGACSQQLRIRLLLNFKAHSGRLHIHLVHSVISVVDRNRHGKVAELEAVLPKRSR